LTRVSPFVRPLDDGDGVPYRTTSNHNPTLIAIADVDRHGDDVLLNDMRAGQSS
jgi:hypothetical protein